MSDSRDVTDLLDAWNEGDTQARDELMPLVYEELRKIANRQFRRESGDHTLQPTAVVNEAYIRLTKQRKVRWRSRVEFFAIAAQHIRHILVDHARRRLRKKRGGGAVKLPLDNVVLLADSKAPGLIALDDVLKDLASFAPRQGEIVERRIFGGLTVDEVAESLDVGRSTVSREWNAALLFMRRELSESGELSESKEES